MTDVESLLAAVRAAPADDTPRLVYADWLDDHGDPARAEFIRLQVELARDPKAFRNPARHRAEELRKAHAAAWKAELPTIPGVDWGGFTRGFVAAASVRPGGDLAARFAAVFAAAPVEAVKLIDCAPEMLRTLVRSAATSGLRAITSRTGYTTDEELEDLAATPAAAGLERLEVGGLTYEGDWPDRRYVPRITDRAALALARSPHLARLRWLGVRGADLSPDARDTLVRRFGGFWSADGGHSWGNGLGR